LRCWKIYNEFKKINFSLAVALNDDIFLSFGEQIFQAKPQRKTTQRPPGRKAKQKKHLTIFA